MTALALLSMIAPAASGVPKGPSGVAASGFRSLMETLSDAETGGPEAGGPQAKSSQIDTAAELDEAKVETPAAGLSAAPTPPAQAFVIEDEVQVMPGAGSNPTMEGNDEAGADAPASPSLGDRGDRSGNVPLQDRSGNVPLPADKGATGAGNEPQPQPRATDARTTGASTPEIPGASTGAAAATEAAEANARTNAAPTPPLPVAAPPAALRPLAERLSRPLDAQTIRMGDGSPAADPASSSLKSATAPAPPAPDQSFRPADLVAAMAGREIARGGDAGASAPDMPPLDEGGTAQTQAASAPRETAVSQLSRGAIEATAQIAAQILRRLEGRSTRFEIALRPDELGRVDVKLDIDAEGRLKARMAFDNPAAATDLRGRADELRRQLEDAGFHLADDAFEFADRDSGSSAFDRGQGSPKGPSRAFADASRLNAEIDVDQPPRWLSLSLSPSGVDMKV